MAKRNPLDKARKAYEDALEAGIHIDIGSHNRARNPAKRKGTAKPRRVSQVTRKPPTKRLVARRRANTAPGYFPNPVNDPAKGALEMAIVSAIKAAHTPSKLANKTDNMLTAQARLSFAQGLIQAAEIMGVFTRAETKLFLMQLKPEGVIGR